MEIGNPITVDKAGSSWTLLMQSGVTVECRVGVTAAELLSGEFAVPAEILARIDAILVDGQPVDDLDRAIVPDGARLALAAGLPGIAGLAMKRGSAVRALRGGITHMGSGTVARPGPGRIVLSLYSLALQMLGAHFLRRGVLVAAGQFERYAGFAPDDVCRFAGETMPAGELAARLRRNGTPADCLYLFTANIVDENG